jgi:hypothetical protein
MVTDFSFSFIQIKTLGISRNCQTEANGSLAHNGCVYGLAAFSAACLYTLLPAGTDY